MKERGPEVDVKVILPPLPFVTPKEIAVLEASAMPPPPELMMLIEPPPPDKEPPLAEIMPVTPFDTDAKPIVNGV